MIAAKELTSPGEQRNRDKEGDSLQEELISMEVDQSLVELNVFEEQIEDARETRSTCEINQRFSNSEDSSMNRFQDNQLLSAVKLLENSNQSDQGVSFIDVNVPKQIPAQDYNTQREFYFLNVATETDMYSRDQLQISPNTTQELDQFKEFIRAKPRLSFASQKMKDYFDSFRSHRGERARLYQFFKSIRTELVACLLFTIITSQAIIVCRTHLNNSFESPYNIWIANGDTQSRTLSDKRQVDLRDQLGISQPGSSRNAATHLISGLVTSLTVASLTQVFGHVSGCHLIPSISLALYVKGHISRARLASYLFAQFIGSLSGVSLLGLLTTSQLTPDEYREILQSHNEFRFVRENSLVETINNGKSAYVLRDEARLEGRRHRREAPEMHLENDLINDANFSSDPFQASETILLSIEEQQQRRQHDKRNQISNEANSETSAEKSTSNLSATPTNNATSERHDKVTSSASGLGKSDDPGTKNKELALYESSRVAESRTTKREGQFENDEVARISKRVSKIAFNKLDNVGDKPTDISSKKHHSSAYIESESQQSGCDQPKFMDGDQSDTSTDNKMVRLRRRKRNRQINITANLPPIETSQFEPNSGGSKYYINLLGFSLPDQIMSSESIRQCIELQSGELQQEQHQRRLDITMKNKKLSKLADNGFQHCLSVSNSSQMFVFQLLATLIVVLTYLVNVDPRRVDLGFKSLSIGLSYFVASALAIQSGGFFGNPFHLLCLSWFSQATNWQPEWFIYLVTPLIGGLFGALSHEYIDFSSPRNSSKQLHLRRSFYSLDNLQQPTANSAVGNQVAPTSAAGSASAPAVESAHLSVVSSVPDLRLPQRAASSTSGSFESVEVASSVLNSPNGQRNSSSCGETHMKPNPNRKFESYSRRLRFEQRQAKVAQLQCAIKLANESTASLNSTLGCSSSMKTRRGHLNRIKATQLLPRPDGTARMSQYEPNFLISSLPTERQLVSRASILM